MARTNRRATFSFVGKLVAAASLAALADHLFYFQWIGATLGLFALAWGLALFVIVHPVRRRPGAFVALVIALALGALMIEAPSLLAWSLFWTAIASAALLTRHRFDDALRWLQRLVLYIVFGLARPFTDLYRLVRTSTKQWRMGIAGAISVLTLPLIGGAVFITLFASANPVIADALATITIPMPLSVIAHAILWSLVFVAVWPSLRPPPRATGMAIDEAHLGGIFPEAPVPTIILSLLTFNAIFAVQNALDIAFLWSGAPLPGQITLADYAHRGAYSLIATALLAGMFVLVALRPGSPSAGRGSVKLLVSLWVAQNVLLVASSMLRLLDYVAAYSLTVLRIQALAWMALVGVGLLLICWRLLRGKSGAWLINANALAGALTLLAFSAIDAGAIAAQYNVRHAREVGGTGPAIDLCYLRQQGPAALLPLIELEGRTRDPALLDRVRTVRERVLNATVAGQADWHSWTWRNARRLEQALLLMGPGPALPGAARYGRECDGTPLPPPEIQAPVLPPATETIATSQPQPLNGSAAAERAMLTGSPRNGD